MEKYNKKKAGNQVIQEFSKGYVSERMQTLIEQCGNWLNFIADEPIEKRKLIAANFCKWRFCPFCAWNKARKDVLRISTMMQYIHKEHRKEFIFLTLTVPNVPAAQLRDEVSDINIAFNKLTKYDEVKNMNFGFLRKLEITYNPQRDDYHPHLHIVMAVNRRYFHGGRYVKQQHWLELWRKAKRDDSITQVDVRKVKKNQDNGIMGESFEASEFAKYAAKDADYARDADIFDAFYTALKSRRQLTFGGLFKEANTLYKDGELDEYIKEDRTEYYWDLSFKWGGEKYTNSGKRMINAMERYAYENWGILIDPEVDEIKFKQPNLSPTGI